jgi:hypothetical protein
LSTPSDLSDGFFTDLMSICANDLKCNAIDLLTVMQSESGVSASARNSQGTGAFGLNQITNLPGVDFNDGPDAFVALSAQDQLPFVKKYFSSHVSQGLFPAGRIYQINFLPGTLDLGSDFGVVICDSQGINSRFYNGNKTLDFDGKGRIIVGDLQDAVVRNARGDRWNQILARFDGRDVDDTIDLRRAEGIQAALLQLGFTDDDNNPLTVDGAIGSKTRQALKKFQKSPAGVDTNGNPLFPGDPDGRLYPDTLTALDAALTAANVDHRGAPLPAFTPNP